MSFPFKFTRRLIERIELFAEPKTELWYFVAAEEGAGIYVGLKNGTSKKDFESALASGVVADLLHRIPSRAGQFYFYPKRPTPRDWCRQCHLRDSAE